MQLGDKSLVVNKLQLWTTNLDAVLVALCSKNKTQKSTVEGMSLSQWSKYSIGVRKD